MTKCEHCKTKKVGLEPFTCKCEYKKLCIYCHLPSNHNCTFDYKQEWKNKLKKELPVVIADKLNRI